MEVATRDWSPLEHSAPPRHPHPRTRGAEDCAVTLGSATGGHPLYLHCSSHLSLLTTNLRLKKYFKQHSPEGANLVVDVASVVSQNYHPPIAVFM